jgi:hypothetical protein
MKQNHLFLLQMSTLRCIQVVTSLEIPEIFARSIASGPGVVLDATQILDIITFLEEYDSYAEKAITIEFQPYRAIFAFNDDGRFGTNGIRAAFLTEDYKMNWALKSEGNTFGPADILEQLEELNEWSPY